jgi:hypothetical protein
MCLKLNFMRKIIKKEKESLDTLSVDFDSLQQESDQVIFEQISKRRDETQALKKLLENLGACMPKNGINS